MFTMIAVWALQSGVAEARERPGTELVVRVVDAQGAPVRYGTLRFADEQWDRHNVNTFDGSWAGTALFPKDGGQREFHPGDRVTFAASAPGFAAQTVTWTVPKGRRAAMDVTVAPFDLGSYVDGPSFAFTAQSLAAIADPATASLDDLAAFGRLMVATPGHHAEVVAWTGLALDGSDATSSGDDYVARKDRLLGIRAVSASAEWSRALVAFAEDPTDERYEYARQMRDQVDHLSRAWAEYDVAAGVSPLLAQQLCGSAAADPSSCRK